MAVKSEFYRYFKRFIMSLISLFVLILFWLLLSQNVTHANTDESYLTFDSNRPLKVYCNWITFDPVHTPSFQEGDVITLHNPDGTTKSFVSKMVNEYGFDELLFFDTSNPSADYTPIGIEWQNDIPYDNPFNPGDREGIRFVLDNNGKIYSDYIQCEIIRLKSIEYIPVSLHSYNDIDDVTQPMIGDKLVAIYSDDSRVTFEYKLDHIHAGESYYNFSEVGYPVKRTMVEPPSVSFGWESAQTTSSLKPGQKYNVLAYTIIGGNSKIYSTNSFPVIIPGGNEESTSSACDTAHDWGAPSYTWSNDNKKVTAIRICKNDSNHKEAETVPATAQVTKKASYTAMGQTTYTAKFKNSAFKIQKKTITNIAKLPKKANTITVKTKKPIVKFAKLKKKAQTIAVKKAFSVSKAKGKVTYKKISGNRKISIKSVGKITLKKGLKKGAYKLKVKVTAAGGTEYKAGSKTVTVRIRVK